MFCGERSPCGGLGCSSFRSSGGMFWPCGRRGGCMLRLGRGEFGGICGGWGWGEAWWALGF